MFKKIVAFFKNLRKTRLIRKLIKVIVGTTPEVRRALADGTLTDIEKKAIAKTLILNIVNVLFESEDKTYEEAVKKL